MPELIRVGSQSRSTAVAGAVAGIMRQQKSVEIQAVGPAAVNQAIKAVTIARGYLAEDRIALLMVPEFVTVEIDDQERTALRLIVFGQTTQAAAIEEQTYAV